MMYDKRKTISMMKSHKSDESGTRSELLSASLSTLQFASIPMSVVPVFSKTCSTDASDAATSTTDER